MNHERTHLDLFSGIGGFSLGLERAGFRTVGFSEVDPFACSVLKQHWPSVPNFGDVRNVPAIRCDILTGGFPCQPFSQAGKRRGKEDDRYLWPAMLDAIKRCQPTWVIGENVAGIIGLDFCQMLTDLEDAGYQCQTLLIPACAVGAIHRRDRVWILAHATSGRRPPGSGNGSSVPSGDRLALSPWLGHRVILGKCHRDRLWCFPDSDPCRSFDGFSDWAHRLKAVGNAIVPKIAWEIGKAINKIESEAR